MEYKPVWQNLKPLERVYIKYESNITLPTHKALINNQIQKEVKAMERNGWVTNETNNNLNPSHK